MAPAPHSNLGFLSKLFQASFSRFFKLHGSLAMGIAGHEDFSFPSGLHLAARLSDRVLWNPGRPFDGPEGWVQRLPSPMLLPGQAFRKPFHHLLLTKLTAKGTVVASSFFPSGSGQRTILWRLWPRQQSTS